MQNKHSIKLCTFFFLHDIIRVHDGTFIESGEYEKLCAKILKELFMDDLSIWKEQKKSNADLYRFDLICKIKDDKVSPFWKFLEDFFNTKYIIFEFKNYKDAITQKEIYTTEKYLYAKALRSVAIVLSCNGADKNADRAIKGVLRESGKLIISVSNQDVIRMLEAKRNGEEPSDYLYAMLDNMLMDSIRVPGVRFTSLGYGGAKDVRYDWKYEENFKMFQEMLKNGKPFGKDYFDELLERICEIRASERRAYQKITDVFEQCSYDYDKNSETTKNFYAFVQNKLHFAVTGKTAVELIYERADSEKPAMGLITWKDAPNGKVLKKDIRIAKNYLNEKELSRLNRLVTMFIDYTELMAEDEILMSVQDWAAQTNQFLMNNRRKVLLGK